jgi:hypothetical protein
MTDSRRYRPPSDEEDEFARQLRELIVWALGQARDQHGVEIARAVARQLDRGRWRLMTRVHVDRDGEPDVDSLWYRVVVQGADGWVELCEARWPALGVSEESAREEARMTAMQHGYGVPSDLAGLTDSPS